MEVPGLLLHPKAPGGNQVHSAGVHCLSYQKGAGARRIRGMRSMGGRERERDRMLCQGPADEESEGQKLTKYMESDN